MIRRMSRLPSDGILLNETGGDVFHNRQRDVDPEHLIFVPVQVKHDGGERCAGGRLPLRGGDRLAGPCAGNLVGIGHRDGASGMGSVPPRESKDYLLAASSAVSEYPGYV